MTMNKVLKVAISQIGVFESPAGSNNVKYNTWFYGHAVHGDKYAWCATYLDWCFQKAGLGSLYPHNENAAYAQDEIVSRCGGKWIMKKNKSKSARQAYLSKAKPGDIVDFDFGAMDAYRRHTGIVEKVDGNSIICIEGNTSESGSQNNGGRVCRKTRRYVDICSAARPAWPGSAEASSRVLDISAWQGEVSKADWKKVMKDGIKLVILRSSYTEKKSFLMHTDKVFKNNIQTAIKAGMAIGIYHYSQAITEAEARKEADFCLDLIKPFAGDISLPVAFDWEFGGRLNSTVAKRNGKTLNGKICDAFCKKIKAAGFEPMVYANLSTLNGYLPAGLHKSWKIWVAQYASKCDYTHPWYLWQFTSSGKVNGISGNLDVSRFPDDEPADFFPPRGYFQIGDKGENVRKMQKLVNKANEGTPWPIAEDGDFGEDTAAGVKLLEDARHLTVDGQFGPKCLDQASKKVTIQQKAINWAVAIARKNSFAYGTGQRAHHYGCFFCGTNITGPKKAAKGSKWEKTYCCNPFITAAYAHGPKIPKVLKACRSCSGGGMSVASWTRYGFKSAGKTSKLKFSDLKKGDILITDKHVCMYTGGDWLVEASSEGWEPSTIAHKKGAKARFESYQKNAKSYVIRYPES